ncbi:hypothetical protein B0H14DRAFT_2564382 [Mycena olivaceomarginata]|nr:hypothetical protein B0H14DRAFT_2564382 [Mycena olivaceomarginata]
MHCLKTPIASQMALSVVLCLKKRGFSTEEVRGWDQQFALQTRRDRQDLMSFLGDAENSNIITNAASQSEDVVVKQAPSAQPLMALMQKAEDRDRVKEGLSFNLSILDAMTDCGYRQAASNLITSPFATKCGNAPFGQISRRNLVQAELDSFTVENIILCNFLVAQFFPSQLEKQEQTNASRRFPHLPWSPTRVFDAQSTPPAMGLLPKALQFKGTRKRRSRAQKNQTTALAASSSSIASIASSDDGKEKRQRGTTPTGKAAR